ncbi:Pollen receptor-like kinase [Thalictrum thalictroides]|uniref:Pollen receptor-like kinase n=1 Tax=Thalictrum thalictroides TaxID=46969 RepID=A0A7J6W8U7_THATH|nr:Pollen receptor-like kinase [Thalictrum thalictroides]
MSFVSFLISSILLFLIHQLTAEVTPLEFYPGERDALIQLREAVKSPVIDLHSIWIGPPCHNSNSNWVGITCYNSHVISIVLDDFQLRGELPSTFLQNITYLRLLSFRNNSLLGPLPSLAGLLHLNFIYLSHNLFTSSIPLDYITLPNLIALELQKNILSGNIPPFNQPTLTDFNVSYNSLQGPIPQTPTLQKLPSSAYYNNLQLCGKPLPNPCPAPPVNAPPPWNQTKAKKKLTVWSIILIAVSTALLPFLVVLVLVCYFRKTGLLNGQETEDDKSGDLAEKKMKNTDPERRVELEFFDKEKPMFDLDDLLRASAELMGKGKLGSTYKVNIEQGSTIAVKRLKEMNGLEKKAFVQQMQLLGKMRHENLVRIVSFYYSKEEKLVVYEYVPCDGSLFELLHEGRGTAGRFPLSWNTRLSIVKGVAEGLLYLHESLPSHKVPHANLKSSNILVSHHSNSNNNQIYLTDYGFLPLITSRKAALDKLSVGRSPEFTHGKKLTHKADVYCFGIVLLEIITGRRVPPQRQDDTSLDDLSDWVRSVVDNDWSTDILDLEISATKEDHNEMLKLAEIALECTSEEPEKRPKMNQVLTRIKSIK